MFLQAKGFQQYLSTRISAQNCYYNLSVENIQKERLNNYYHKIKKTPEKFRSLKMRQSRSKKFCQNVNKRIRETVARPLDNKLGN